MTRIQKLAKLAGVAYLVQMTTSILGYIPPQTLASGDVTAAAKNLISNETLFRAGIAANLITYITVLVLIWALYHLLKPANKPLAQLALLLRLGEVIVLSVGLLGELLTIRLLTNPDYLNQFKPDQLHALAKLGMILYGRAFEIGFIFLGLGSAVFSYVWLKSGYIPKLLAILGIFASLLIGAGNLAAIIIPEVKVVFPYAYGSMFVFEVGLGLWLLTKGVKVPDLANHGHFA